ncbi:MAG TPA: cob(I)yrinic acid a,c-diamide adenosyltransferase [bacterium]|nr:cob(I)yrinic acid a,c-diamide adenosyltransferase [bacterium]
MAEKGFVHVYTGNGKGKTTAALGLAMRAAGAGKKVFIGQFVKGMHYSELDLRIQNIEIKQYGADCFIYKDPTENDIKIARDGLAEMADILKSGKYDVVIMDEACIALYYKLFSFEELWKAVSQRAEHVEVVITGRYAPDALIEKADLVTEMKEIKHYYTKGIQARTGIEK